MTQACLIEWIALNRSQNQFVQELTRDLSSTDIHWNPAPKSWSIAQCLEHVNRTTSLYGPGIAQAVAQQKPYRDDYRPGWMGSKMMRFVGPNAKARLKAPSSFKPAEQPESDGVEDFLRLQNALVEQMVAAQPCDLNRSKLRSPALPILRMSLGVAFDLLGQHTQRHLNQALRVRSHDDFPGPKWKDAVG